MAVAVRSASFAKVDSGTSLAVTKPSGTASGDVLVAVAWQDSDGNANLANLTPPAGWTQSGSNITSSSTSPCGKVWSKVAGGSEGASYTFGIASGSSAVISMLAISGANTDTPIAVAATANTGSGTSVVAPSISPSSGDLLVCSFAAQSGSITWTPPSGMTEQVDQTTAWVGAEVATLVLSSGGATGTKTATAAASPSGNWRTVSLAVSGTIAKSGSVLATIRLAATRTGQPNRTGVTTAPLVLAATRTAAQARSGSPAAAALVLAASVSAGKALVRSPAAAALVLAASRTGNKVNVGVAAMVLSATVNDVLHEGTAVAAAPLLLAAATSGTSRATPPVTTTAVLLLAGSQSGTTARAEVMFPAPLYLAAAANALKVVTEISAELRAKPPSTVSYELVCVARIPQSSGPPLLIEVDPIDWTGLSFTDELSKAPTLNAGCQISNLTEPVLQRLRDLASLPTELWLYRAGKLVFAGPLLVAQTQGGGEGVSLYATGLLGYLRWMVVDTDLVYSQVDQFAIAAGLIDQWQSGPYSHFGIDTTGIAPSGIVRDGIYLAKELHPVGQRVEELGSRQNGFDVSVDPAARKLQLDFPQRGVDRSTGEDAIVFDARNVTSSDIVVSAGPGDLASEGYGTGTGGDALYSVRSNLELRATFGRTAITGTWSDVSEQSTLDAHVQGLVDARGAALLVPGPNVRVTPDADLGAYDVGDTVSYQVHGSLSIQGAYRLRKRQVTVSKTGQESTSLEFV